MRLECSYASHLHKGLYKCYCDAVTRGLGTQLRHLTELLDGAVAEAYKEQGLHYRPRYFPVMQALLTRSPLNITEIAETAGLTQPAATQTIALMVREGLLTSKSSTEDGRQKVIEITPWGRDLLPQLQTCWDAVTIAAHSLDAELPFPLSRLLDLAIEAVSQETFASRIRAARGNRPAAHSKRQAK